MITFIVRTFYTITRISLGSAWLIWTDLRIHRDGEFLLSYGTFFAVYVALNAMLLGLFLCVSVMISLF